jgi:hypothetical protein
MIHIRQEGEIIRNGFNFYPLTDKGSVGFIFKLGKRIFRIRYSKITGKLNVKGTTLLKHENATQ